MRSSQSNEYAAVESDFEEEIQIEQVEQEKPEQEVRGFRAVVRRFKKDLREPLPGTEGLGRWGKLKARITHLAKRYGWKLLVAVILYYLIRDTILYIIIPYLIARHFID